MSNRKILNDNEKPKENLRQTQKKKPKRPSSKLINKSVTSDKILVKNELTPTVKAAEFRLERTSTPNLESMCEHCNHSHKQECCMYVYDNYDDIQKYATFKQEVEEPYSVIKNGEDFAMKIGATTPSFFPGCTERIPDVAEMRSKPCMYLRQYFWPIIVPPTYQPPPIQVYNVNQFVHNPNNIKYYQPPVFIGSIYPQTPMTTTAATQYMQLQAHYQPYQRQIPVPLQHGNATPYLNYKPPQQQVIESHNYVPVNYNQNYYFHGAQ